MEKQNAMELRKVFEDPERLKGFSLMKQMFGADHQMKNTDFHMELPYQQIKDFVVEIGDLVMSGVPDQQRQEVVWEHVGSTSIKGMPGTKFPDALLLVPEFPPTQEIIQAMLDAGFVFCQSSLLDSEDLWFMLFIKDGFLKDHLMTVHLCPVGNVGANILLDTRDMCNSEDWAFQDYKAAKIAASKANSMIEYKIGKGEKSQLLQMLREKYGANIDMHKGLEKMREESKVKVGMKISPLPMSDTLAHS